MAKIQPKYQGEGVSTPVDLFMMTGEGNRWVDITHVLTSAEIQDVVFQITDLDTGTVMLSYEQSSQPTYFDISTDELVRVKIQYDDTESMTSTGNYEYACQITDLNDNPYTPQYGTFEFTRDPIPPSAASSPHLAWVTREDYTTELAGLMATGDITQLAVTATSGAGTVTVDSIRTYTATDTLWIQVGTSTGAYEEHVVSTISGTVVTLTATLSAEAPVGNFVRKI